MYELNITSGQEFNDYIIDKENGLFMPFNEAMIEGIPVFPPFSEEFIKERITTYGCTENEYTSIMSKLFYNKEEINNYDSIVLWFGHDTFCQINLITILAYLEYIDYKGQVYRRIIDDETKKIISPKSLVYLGEYEVIYKNVLVNKNLIPISDSYIKKACEEYLYLYDENNDIITFIKNNHDKTTRRQLVEALWDMTRKYGLGDVQVIKLINKYSN